MPLSGIQSTVHFMTRPSSNPVGNCAFVGNPPRSGDAVTSIDIALQQKVATLSFHSTPTASAVVEPVVSSTSSIGGFGPRQQCLGPFSLLTPLRHGKAWCHRPDLSSAAVRQGSGSAGGSKVEIRSASQPGSPNSGLSLADYLQKILTARVYDVAVETALERAPALSTRLGCNVLLKREDTQPVFSFKLRGAYNKMAHLSRAQLRRGVICASAGNHAQGVALAANRLKCKAIIVMPVTTPSLKIDAVRALGGEVVLHGDSYSDAYVHAMHLKTAQGLTFVHPFDDPDVIAGQGTIAMEILRQHQAPIDAVFVAIGGGGLISGIGAYIKSVRPEIRVIGVQMTDSDAMLRSVEAGKRVQLADVGLFSDGTAVKLVGEETFRLAREVVDEFVVVDTDAACAAIKDVFQDTRSILEPAGALGVAAIKQYCARSPGEGKDLRRDHLRREHELRPPALRGGARRGRRGTRSLVRGDDSRRARQLPPLLRTARPARGHRVQLPHRRRDRSPMSSSASRPSTGMSRASWSARSSSTASRRSTSPTTNWPSSTSATWSADAARWRTTSGCTAFCFPKRPGALMRFLSSMPAGWNISLFHYRNQGADYGRILVGIQVPPADKASFRKFLRGLAYPCQDETDNPAYRLFLA